MDLYGRINNSFTTSNDISEHMYDLQWFFARKLRLIYQNFNAFPVFVSHCGWREMDYWSDYPFIIADSYVNV